MAKYDISHPQLPQLRGILELPEGEQPNERHFWEAAKTMVRPYGASGLTDEAKIIAYRNGFFDAPDMAILDQEDDPDTIQDEEAPGLLSSLWDMSKEGVRRVAKGTSPHEKVFYLGSKLDPYNRKMVSQDYSTDKFSEQLREAGKLTFGNLDNAEIIYKLDDVVGRSLRQVGLKPTKSNRAKAIGAARDYSEGNVKASLGQGGVRAMYTGSYVAEGVPYLMNKILTDEADDGDVLDAANSVISFDKLNYEVENADKLAAFVADNKVETLKAASSGIVGGVTPILEREDVYGAIGSPESLEVDSPMLEDLRSGYQEPSEGLSFLTEVVADPLNLAGASAAKGVTAPMRIGLKGRMLKTIKGVEKNTTRLAQLQAALKKMPEDALVRGRIEGQAVKVAEELAEQQKILQKYGSNSLLLRLAGKASPETLGKVAMETFDQSTDAGKVGMGLVREATKATDEMSKLRRVANVAAKYNPEIAGATVGAMIAGPGGAIAGAALPMAIKVVRVIAAMPQNLAIRAIITASQNAGEEITEQAARQRYKNFKTKSVGILGLSSAAGFSMDLDELGGFAGIGALAALLGPKTLSLVDNVARDARVIGSELTLARTGDHTPFFRRLAMLPTPDEGLIGANTDKFNILMRAGPEGFFGRAKDVAVQGSKASVREVFPTPQPFRRGPQGEAIGRAPTISGATQKFANFLDKPGVVGRLGTPIESLGRFGKGMAVGASIPATIGFIASGGQAGGAIAGAIMSAPFTALGSGAGMYQNYKTKGDLYAKQIGDVQYYREHLTKPERVEFDALPANIRAEIAGYSLSHPDVVFKQTAEGEGGFDPVNMEVTYNPDGTGFLKGTMAHEITHFMEIHGLTPMVNRILFGDESTRTPGEFASYDSDGKIVYTDEFIKLRDIYMDKVRKDASLDPDAVAAYESDPKKIGREIFADQGADFLLSGKREKALNQGPLGKLVGATIDGITGVSFLRDFLLKLNLPLNSEGKFITSTGLFDGKLRKIPELQNLIEKYYKDVRGLKKAQIEGEKVADPLTKRTREKKGARPIDDEFDTLYTVEDQKDPNVVDKLNTGGIFKTNPKTGEIEKDLLGNPVRMTKGEADKVSQAAGDHAAKVFEQNGIEVEINDKGRPFVKDLGALNENIIDQLAKGPIHPRQIAALREISRALRQGDGERAGMLIGYYSASTGRKPKAVPFKLRTTMPYGFELTAQGNILVRLHDTQQIQRNLKFLKGKLQANKLPDELIGMYDDLFGNDNAVWDAFATYRNNTSNGIDGRTGLDPDPVKANKKLNFLNALHGAFDKAHVAKNPVLSAIGYKRASSNNKREPFGTATRTFRLDRIFDAKRSGEPGKGSGFNLERAKDLMSPQGQKLMMPQMELDFSPPKAAQSSEAKPNFWKIYRIDPKGPKVYDEVADVLIQVGSPWMDGSIIESKAPILGLEKGKLRQAMNRAHRRADRGGGKQFMPAAYHGTPHTFKAEEGAPLGKFKSSQIGTGEGAQAYGHGLYFAGKRDVAEHYRKTLARDENPNKWKEKPGAESFDEEVNFILDDAAIMSKTNAEFLKDLEALETQATSGKYEYSPVEVFHIKKAVSLVKSGDVELAKGSLYKVELAPKENEYLLWDKPVPDRFIDKIVEKSVDEGLVSDRETAIEAIKSQDADRQGSIFYRELSDQVGGDGAASQFLKEAGIPGIKYLDGDSRSKGKGDYNYVIFDEADVTITEKQFMPASEAGASKGNVKTKSDPAPLGKLSATFPQWDAIAELQKEGQIVRDAIPGKNRTVIAKVERGGGVTDDVIIKPDGTFDAGEGNILFMPSPGDTTPSSVQSWDGPNPTFATKLTKGMAKDNKEIAALLRQTYEDTFGEPLKAKDFSDTEVTWLADMLATEGEAALSRTGNAVDWYTTAVERALSVAEEIFPDIGKKFEAKDRFLGALSITSQNMKVLDNAKASVMQYEHKLRTGKFNYKVKHGEKGKAITKNLRMYDEIEAKMGIDDFHNFLDEDFTVKELSEWGKKFFNNKKFSIAGYQTDKVKGSAVFGPKIGQGFFQNLRGNYDPVTVDLWLRRTYGRLTGLALDTALTPKDIGKVVYSVRKNVGKRKFAGVELPDFLQGVRITGNLQKDGKANFRIFDKSFESLFGDNTIGRDNTEAIFEFAEKLNREWERNFAKAGNDVKKAKDAIRKAKKKGKGVVNLEKKLAKLEVEKEAIGNEKPQWAKAGSTITDKLKPIDVPSNAERAVITKAFNEALEQLRSKGINLTPADLQATLWYPEKDIWAYLKGRDSNALNMSYDTAMEMIRDQRK